MKYLNRHLNTYYKIRKGLRDNQTVLELSDGIHITKVILTDEQVLDLAGDLLVPKTDYNGNNIDEN